MPSEVRNGTHQNRNKDHCRGRQTSGHNEQRQPLRHTTLQQPEVSGRADHRQKNSQQKWVENWFCGTDSGDDDDKRGQHVQVLHTVAPRW